MATSTTHRVVHLGTLSTADGAEKLIELGRLLRGRVRVDLSGNAHKALRPMLLRAHDEGSIVWHGPLPLDGEQELLDDALMLLNPLHYPRSAAATILTLRDSLPAGTSAPR